MHPATFRDGRTTLPCITSCRRPSLSTSHRFAIQGWPARIDHPLLTIIVMALVGVICGANGWEDIEEIAEDRKDWFTRFLEMPHGVPSADTFRRVIGALRPAAFHQCITSWVQTLAEPLNGQVVAIDGKTLRGALRRTPWGEALHQMHVWACKPRLLLALREVIAVPHRSRTDAGLA
jgi:DDE_Tnp_1-associated